MLRCPLRLKRIFGSDSTKKITSVISVVVFFVFMFAEPAAAQESMLQQMATTAGFGGASLPVIVARLIRTFISVLGIIAVIIVIYAGWLYMTAGGDAEQVNRAKRMLTQGAIGLFLILGSFSITQFILGQLLEGVQPQATVTTQGPGGGLYSEPLSGSLGAGIINDHYPPRDAIDVPRNVNIFVTFKQPINPDTIITDYSQDPQNTTTLNNDNILIYPTDQGEAAALGPDDVVVTVNDDNTIFTFNPVDLLGSANEDTNYTVSLQSGVQLENGDSAFQDTGGGYEWTFEVSTEVDWTPPVVESVQPAAGGTHPRNTVVEVTFNEAMNPVAATGSFDGAGQLFDNIEVFSGGTSSADRTNGTFEIGNNYRTVTFFSDDVCAEDACGDPVYCLPGNQNINVWAHSAAISANPPQAELTQGLYNGLVDAAGNALDGNDNFDANNPSATMEGRGGQQSVGDDYRWSFTTNTNLNTETPQIEMISPGIDEANVGQDQPVEITFSMPMMGSSLDSESVQLWPFPSYEFWFSVGKEDIDASGNLVSASGNPTDMTRAIISHPTFIPPEEQAWDYYPLVNEGAKGINQFCMYPTEGPGNQPGGSCGTSPSEPYCCNGTPSATACSTESADIEDDQGITQTVPPAQLPDPSSP
jgi:hypothetical protein